MPGDQVSRRRVLAGLGATLLVSGCSAAPRAGDEPVEAPTVDPDEEIRRAAADAERALLAAYGATIARHPTLTERLAAFSAHHDEHLAAFSDAAPSPSLSPSGPTQSATANPGDSGATGVSDDPLAAVATLAIAERAAASRSMDDLDSASPTLARLLASVGAAEAAHAALLGT